MTERERRNELIEADLYCEPEFLVFGSFREDDDDHGFKARGGSQPPIWKGW